MYACSWNYEAILHLHQVSKYIHMWHFKSLGVKVWKCQWLQAALRVKLNNRAGMISKDILKIL